MLVGAIACRLEKTPQVPGRRACLAGCRLAPPHAAAGSRLAACPPASPAPPSQHSLPRCPLQTAAPTTSPQGPQLYILTLGVLAPYRGLGAGSSLLRRCLEGVAEHLPEVHEAVLHVQARGVALAGSAGGALLGGAAGGRARVPRSEVPTAALPGPTCCLQTNNDAAIQFYQRHGFEVTETIAGYYRRLDPPDAVVLRKRLQPKAGANGAA